MTTLKTAEKVLKDYYLDVIQEQFNTGINPFYTAIEKTSEYVTGKQVKKIVNTKPTNYVYALGEEDEIPNSVGNSYAVLTSDLKNFYGKIEVSDKAIRASQDGEGAVVSVLNAEMEGLLQNAKEQFASMLFRGHSQHCLGVVTSNTTSVEKVYVTNVAVFKPGMHINILQEEMVNTSIPTAIIETVNIEEGYITLVDDRDSAGEIYKGDRLALDAYNGLNNLTGINDLFSEYVYTIYGINKSKNSWICPYQKELSESIKVLDLQEIIDKIEEKSGDVPNMIMCSWKTRRILQALFAENHIVLDNVVLDGGYKAISYNGIPIVVDKYCPDGEIYFLNTDYFKLCQLCDWEWLTDDDGRILKQVPNKAAYTATLVKYAELICEKPCAQGRLTGVV